MESAGKNREKMGHRILPFLPDKHAGLLWIPGRNRFWINLCGRVSADRNSQFGYFASTTRHGMKARHYWQNCRSQTKNYRITARQIETLAAAEERNRLARELHDSVSQTIFSMNLTAQSARILLDRDPQRVAGLLDHLQVLSQNALGEMRSLIQQLRPHSLIENGLAAALKNHAAERLEQDNLKVDVQVKGEGRTSGKCGRRFIPNCTGSSKQYCQACKN